jgi:hypothetical protein
MLANMFQLEGNNQQYQTEQHKRYIHSAYSTQELYVKQQIHTSVKMLPSEVPTRNS